MLVPWPLRVGVMPIGHASGTRRVGVASRRLPGGPKTADQVAENGYTNPSSRTLTNFGTIPVPMAETPGHF